MNHERAASGQGEPVSGWVRRWAELIPPGARLLDYACGGGRHARYFAARGLLVSAVDRDAEALAALSGLPGIQPRCADLEGAVWPLAGEAFDAIVVTRYLYRPRLADLIALLRPSGVLIYETFALGNEVLGRPSNPEFLLREAELLEVTQPALRVVAFEQGRVDEPRPAVVQRICAVGAEHPWPVRLSF